MNVNADDPQYRTFHDENVQEVVPEVKSTARNSNHNKNALIAILRNDIVGSFKRFTGPYGPKSLIYADWTASGRALQQIEFYISSEVLDSYGNTHTTTSRTGHQSTCFRLEARQIVAQAVNAKITGRAADDVVLFTGNGTTSAVSKLVLSLGLHVPLPPNYDDSHRPLVLTSSYEHHSNLLPWRESVAEVVTVAYHPVTGVCLEDLKCKLESYQSRRFKIGAFSAASNVTGILTDVDAVSILLHMHGALAFFDYATAAPYVKIDMNPVSLLTNGELAYKDAIYFSGHKFLGGPGCPGVLIAKRKVLAPLNEVPAGPGGGTVFFVSEDHHRYLSNREEREESGTPNLIGDVKLGLVVHLHQSVGAAWIEEEEIQIAEWARERFRQHPGVVLVGHDLVEGSRSLPVFSFLIRCGKRFLHHNFVCALLNDLFGIQSRGGCQCAGPFSQALLGMSAQAVMDIETVLLDKNELYRPGLARVSLPYWMSPEEREYVLRAIHFVADFGSLFLHSYRCNPKTGEWAHTSRLTRFPERVWLSAFDLSSRKTGPNGIHSTNEPNGNGLINEAAALKEWGVSDTSGALEKMFHAAIEAKDQAKREWKRATSSGHETAGVSAALETLRWFVVSEDVEAADFAAAKPDQGLAEPLLGPVQPSLWSPFPVVNPVTREPRSGSVSTVGTAYGAIRGEFSLTSRHGWEGSLPRYLTLQESDASSGVVQGAAATDASHEAFRKKRRAEDETAVTVVTKVEAAAAKEATCAVRIGEKRARNATESAVTVKPIPPPKKLMKLTGQAMMDWKMIKEGDRLLLGLSGGKDSLALLHILIAIQKRAPVKFEIACATVDPQTASFDPSPLIPYVEALGIKYHFLSEPIIELAKDKLQGDSLCAFCSRMKRGLLYGCCRKNGYNKLVLAQHLDDLAESFVMSTFHNGQVRTMKANYAIDSGDLTVIRPLVYVREKDLRDFSMSSHLPIINENCPACFEQPKERHRVKQLLKQEETMVPDLFFKLRQALKPLMHSDMYVTMAGVMSSLDQAGKDKYQRKTSVTSATQGSTNSSGEVVGLIVQSQDDSLRVDDDAVERQKDFSGASDFISIEESLTNTTTESMVCCGLEGEPPCYELA